jgi:hypothetical protein
MGGAPLLHPRDAPLLPAFLACQLLLVPRGLTPTRDYPNNHLLLFCITCCLQPHPHSLPLLPSPVAAPPALLPPPPPAPPAAPASPSPAPGAPPAAAPPWTGTPRQLPGTWVWGLGERGEGAGCGCVGEEEHQGVSDTSVLEVAGYVCG